MSIIIAIVFLVLIYQDFKERKVFVFLPVILFIAALITMFSNPIMENPIYLTLIINVCTASILLLGINIYCKIRMGSNSKILEVFGGGDIAVIFSLAPLFSYKEFIHAILLACILGCIHALFLSVIMKKEILKYKIPFISWLGISSLIFMFIIPSNL